MRAVSTVLRFNERRATEAAARFLRLRGGRMSYLKLIKMLYFLDREALLRWGRPVTTDRYVSMANGPVVSRIYDLIREEPAPGPIRFGITISPLPKVGKLPCSLTRKQTNSPEPKRR